MSIYKSRRFIALAMITLAFILSACGAQDTSHSIAEGRSDQAATAVASGRANEAELLRGITPAEQLRVEEFLNYYDHRFAPPSGDYAVGLDVSLGSTHVPDAGGEVWLQVGLQAAPVSEQDIHPNNIALVLDKSGSMAEADKMSFLKQSLHVFVDELDPEDLIAIVVYDNDARILLPTQTVGDGQQVRAAIDQLSPGGGTNLHGGLMLGYAEVEKYYAPNLNNRVILLTDGIANQGETDPNQIAADSLAYNEKGIFLSTIGLGLDFNDALLSTLAEQGKGNYHFINDAQEMERVFKQEATSLVQTVATNVWLTLELADGVQVQRVYGYDYELEGNTMRVQFDDAGAESSQILVLKTVVSAGQGAEQILARATLEHDDVFAEAHDVQQTDVLFSYGAPVPYDPLVLPAVRRNVTILQMAEALQQVAFLCDQRKYEEALSLVREVKARVWQIATEEGDAQMQEDVEMLDNYEAILQALVELASRPTSSPTEREPEPSGGLCGPAPLMGLGAVALAFVGRLRKSS